MASLLVVYQVALVVAGVAALGVVAYAWYMEAVRGAREVMGLFLAIALWTALSLLATLVAGTPLAKSIFKIQLWGMTLVPAFAVLAGLQYTGRDRYITRGSVALVSLQPVVVGVVVQFPTLYRMAFRFGATDPGAFYGYVITYDWFLYLNIAWAYVLLGAASVLYFEQAVKGNPILRRQATAILLGIAAPWAGNALFLLGPVPVDLTAFGFTVTGVAVLWAIYSESLMDVIPITKSAIINNVEAGLLVVTWRDRVLEVNPTGARILGLDRDEVVGHTVEEVLAHLPAVRDAVAAAKTADEEFEVHARDRDLRISSTRITDSQGRLMARIVLVDDITEQKQRQRALERQNERLDEFAGVVSHDLRNPLTVAKSRLELVAREADADVDSVEAARDRLAEIDRHAEDAASALERMDVIVDDVLTLARGGKQVETTTSVSLGNVAEAAWENIDAPDATLTIAEDRTLEADSERLQRALENLCRNAVEHGRPDVTITVGATADGFFVADNGSGIPEAKREEVFEHGVTTNDSGTGFGLPIVRDIVEAHGWDIELTESESGGARFDVVLPGQRDQSHEA